MQIPLGWWTDLEVARRSGSSVIHKGDVTVVRTPDNAAYYWGNFVLVPRDFGPDQAEATFATYFPDASHLAIGFLGEPHSWAGPVEANEVRAQRSAPQAPAVAGYQVRALTGEDWRAAWRNEVTGMPDAYADFAWRRIESRQRLCASGDAIFAGCFQDGQLVADLGIVLCGEVARYQSVFTVPEHRGKGLASWLLACAGQWAQRHGAHRWVILSDPDSDASRLYDRLGFGLVENSYQVERAPV